jgi:2-oxoacid:acceptor oxidoreductase delta subunit (pyruvate/2-ketoisovalerate family)
VQSELAEHGFDAVFLAVCAQLSHRAYIPAGQSARVLEALALLAQVVEGDRPQLGRRVVVYGGGNTAMDAARTARRLGAEEALVVYRRTRERMPANDIEVSEALGEGVQFRWLSTIKQVDGGRLQLERMRLDDAGVPTPTGEYEQPAEDSLVLALGQDVDHALVDGVAEIVVADGVVDVDEPMMTGHAGIFAGGNMVRSARSVSVAVGHGARAARGMPDTCGVTAPTPRPVLPPAPFDVLNAWYYSDAPKSVRPELEAARRVSDFTEVVGGLSTDTALYEARRCLSCGNCFGCDNCYGVCPDNAVIKIDGAHGYAIDYDYCKGCGICVAECPCGAIAMEPETS